MLGAHQPHAAPRRLRCLRLPPAVLLVAFLTLAGCGDADDTVTPVPTVSATTAAPTAPQPSPPQPTVTPDDAFVIAITVADGEVLGVEPRTQVPLGARVRLTITSDTADELHVHGYELTERVPADQAVQLEFVADRPGIFELELHDAHRVLTRLQVQ